MRRLAACAFSSRARRDAPVPMKTSPRSAPTRPQSIATVVDLPAPFGPSRPTISPAPTSSDRSATTARSPYDLQRPLASSMDPPGEASATLASAARSRQGEATNRRQAASTAQSSGASGRSPGGPRSSCKADPAAPVERLGSAVRRIRCGTRRRTLRPLPAETCLHEHCRLPPRPTRCAPIPTGSPRSSTSSAPAPSPSSAGAARSPRAASGDPASSSPPRTSFAARRRR